MASPDNDTRRSWAAIAGAWSIGEPEAPRYLGPQPDSPRPFGICLSDVNLTEGTVSTHVRASEITEDFSGQVLLGYRSQTEPYWMAGLGGWNFAYTIGVFEPAFGWRALAVAGSRASLSSQQSYKLRIDLNGQRISLTVDKVRVLEHMLGKLLTGDQVGLFAFGHREVEFSSFSVDGRAGTAFVVMQFSEPYKQLYEEVILPVTEGFKLRAYHVGEVSGPGLILHDIAQGIIEAKVVIAEITPENQNVFYELGYAHALGKPTILLADRRKLPLPFDISGYRVLLYDNTIAGKTQVQEGLKKHLEAILGYPFETPKGRCEDDKRA